MKQIKRRRHRFKQSWPDECRTLVILCGVLYTEILLYNSTQNRHLLLALLGFMNTSKIVGGDTDFLDCRYSNIQNQIYCHTLTDYLPNPIMKCTNLHME